MGTCLLVRARDYVLLLLLLDAALDLIVLFQHNSCGIPFFRRTVRTLPVLLIEFPFVRRLTVAHAGNDDKTCYAHSTSGVKGPIQLALHAPYTASIDLFEAYKPSGAGSKVIGIKATGEWAVDDS